MRILNALTFDVEDYFQVSNFERDIRREEWRGYPSRVVNNTRRILRLLDRNAVQATFYVLGYVAEKYPKIVAEIDAAGHQIGSHSYWHRLVYQLTPAEFREDLRRSRDVLQNIIGKPVTSYRAPSFSIIEDSMWALEILCEEGFTTDSSIFPVRHGRYGIPKARREPHAYDFQRGALWEFPLSVWRLANRFNVPISGGGYFRLLPWELTRRFLQSVNDRSCLPFVFYLHPWEFDPDQPRLKAGTTGQRFRHYVNLATTEAKFGRLLQSFAFTRLDHALTRYRANAESSLLSLAARAS